MWKLNERRFFATGEQRWHKVNKRVTEQEHKRTCHVENEKAKAGRKLVNSIRIGLWRKKKGLPNRISVKSVSA